MTLPASSNNNTNDRRYFLNHMESGTFDRRPSSNFGDDSGHSTAVENGRSSELYEHEEMIDEENEMEQLPGGQEAKGETAAKGGGEGGPTPPPLRGRQRLAHSQSLNSNATPVSSNANRGGQQEQATIVEKSSSPPPVEMIDLARPMPRKTDSERSVLTCEDLSAEGGLDGINGETAGSTTFSRLEKRETRGGRGHFLRSSSQRGGWKKLRSAMLQAHPEGQEGRVSSPGRNIGRVLPGQNSTNKTAEEKKDEEQRKTGRKNPLIKSRDDAKANAVLNRWRGGQQEGGKGMLERMLSEPNVVSTSGGGGGGASAYSSTDDGTGAGDSSHANQRRRRRSPPAPAPTASTPSRRSVLLASRGRRGTGGSAASSTGSIPAAVKSSSTRNLVVANHSEGSDPDYAGFTGLRKLCNTPMLDGRSDAGWFRVRDYLKSLPSDEAKIIAETREGDWKETALHLACRQKPPPDVVSMLLHASPHPASWTDLNNHQIPLHYECQNGVNEEVVKLLTDAYPEGLSAVDRSGHTPLHIATKNDMAPPSFRALRSLMCQEAILTRTARGSYPLTIQYLSDRAEKVLDHDYDERQYAVQCLDVFLDAKLSSMKRPGHRETGDFVSTLEDSPEWFAERASVHPFVQALLNWQITQHFPTVVLMLDFFVLSLLILFFRVASYQSLDARSSYKIMLEEQRVLEEAKGWGNGGGMYIMGFMNLGGQGWGSNAYDSLASFEESHDTGIGLAATLPIYLGALYLLLREMLQMVSLATRGLFHAWLFDIWNYLDVMCFGLVLWTGAYLQTGTGDDGSVRLMVVVTSGVLWMMMLSFLKLTTKDFAVFVSGVVRVTLTLRSFLITLSIFLMAFAQMYFTDFQGREICINAAVSTVKDSAGDAYVDNSFCTAYGSYLRVYMMLAGGGVDEDDFTYDSTALWLSVLFAFMVTILLVNVLIAIVTDSYQEVKSEGEAVFWSHRLSFVFEVDQISNLFTDYLLNPFFDRNHEEEEVKAAEYDARLCHQHLHGLKPHDDSSNASTTELSSSIQASSIVNGTTEQHGHPSERDVFLDKMRDLWEIIGLAYEDPTNFGIWKRKSDLKKRWDGPTWLLGPVINPVVYPDDVKPSPLRRFLFAFFLVGWIIAGALTAGYLWPPQVRRFLLCPAITENEEGNNPATSDEVYSMREEIRDEVQKVENAMEVRMDDMKGQMDQMRETMEEVKVGMGKIQRLLTTMVEHAAEEEQEEEVDTADGGSRETEQ